MRRNRFLTSSRIRVELIRQTGRRVSACTAQGRLAATGYCLRRPARCTRLTNADPCQRCCVWVGRHLNCNHQRWSRVIFADDYQVQPLPLWLSCPSSSGSWWETSGLLHTRNGWKYHPLRHDMGVFYASGKSELVVVDGRVNQQYYIGILRQNLLPWARATFQRNCVLVHDNATSHTARNTHNLLAVEEVKVMQWPARSPELNCIEHIWDQMRLFIRYIDNPPTTMAR